MATTSSSPSSNSPTDPADDASKGAPRLLLVEDEALVRMVVSEELLMLGFAVSEAASCSAAIAAMEKLAATIAVAIVDVGLPDGRGDDLALRLRQRWPAMPVLIVSGYDESSLKAKLGGDTQVGFLRKPYFAEDLVKKLEAFGIRSSGSAAVLS